MPKINFSFEGYVNGAEISTVTGANGKTVDVSNETAENVVANLKSGVWFISLGDYLYHNGKAEIEIFDFEEVYE